MNDLKDVQVLVTTMNMSDADLLLKKMNIDTSFVIGNQFDHDEMKTYEWNGKKGLIITKNEKGVGANRNITLKYASAEYCVLADDDMQFYDDYSYKVLSAFRDNPKADVLIFNLDEENTVRRINGRKKRIGLLNYMNYGAARIAFKRNAISYNGIAFNYNFGGGANHSAGEDSLFLRDCLLHGLKILAIPETIAMLKEERKSTWFDGYTPKYLYDKGVFLGVAHPKLSYLFAVYFAVKHREYRKETKSVKKTFAAIADGIRFVKRGFI